MLKTITIICTIICIVLGGKLLWYMLTPEIYQINIEPVMGSRIAASMEGKEPKHTIIKEFQITHIDGTPSKFYIVKIECCGVGAFVKNNNLYMGYMNEVSYKSPFSTTTEMLPAIDMSILIHELAHLTTIHNSNKNSCTYTNTALWQETNAYDTEHLYTQIKSFHEDNYLRLTI